MSMLLLSVGIFVVGKCPAAGLSKIPPQGADSGQFEKSPRQAGRKSRRTNDHFLEGVFFPA